MGVAWGIGRGGVGLRVAWSRGHCGRRRCCGGVEVIDVEGVKRCVCVKGVMWDGVQRRDGGVAEVWGRCGTRRVCVCVGYSTAALRRCEGCVAAALPRSGGGMEAVLQQR